jgi:hypothetical protein
MLVKEEYYVWSLFVVACDGRFRGPESWFGPVVLGCCR